ncbi:hypothetical protein D3C76_250640 [compost metagenome]
MLLTIRDVSEDLVRQAKIATGKGTGSQAFIAGIELMVHQRDVIDSQREQIARLKEDVARSRMLMRQLAPLCVQVAELAGQKDLFD